MNRRWMFVCAFVLVSLAPSAIGQEHWVTTWAASPQQPRALPPPAPPAAGAAQGSAAAPLPPPPITSFSDQTVRMIVRTSIGGRTARVQFSNAYGSAPLRIGSAHLALREKESTIAAGSDRTLTFNGKPSCTIPPGALMVTDPVELGIRPTNDLAVSLYLPEEVNSLTLHATGLHTTYIAKGDATGQQAIADAAKSQSWFFLSSVDVLAAASTAALVTFGDSITDGARSTPDTDQSWPSVLAQRVLNSNVAVVNQGISGNRVLRDGAGVNALARFDRDVLAVPGVKWVMLLESINDIGIGTRQNASPSDAVTADDLIAGLRQLAERAHMHGIRVIGCTILPYEGAAYYSEAGEVIRQAVNRWIRGGSAFDAVVDFDQLTRDPSNPKHLSAEVDSGDHLHPGDAGYKKMAEYIDLKLFKH